MPAQARGRRTAPRHDSGESRDECRSGGRESAARAGTGTQEGRLNADSALEVYRADLEESLKRVAHKKMARRRFRAMLRAADAHKSVELNTADDRVLVWADLHIGHARIIDYARRPFRDVEHMAAELWRNWEDAVGRQDVLVCLGDLAMGPALREATWARVRSAPGRRKVLVIGNHDLTGKGALRIGGFDEVRIALVSGGEPPFIWTHYPLGTVPPGHVNLHGHLHGSPPGRSRHINVSVEQLDYRPVSLARLRRLARALARGESPAGDTTLARIRRIELGGGTGDA